MYIKQRVKQKYTGFKVTEPKIDSFKYMEMKFKVKSFIALSLLVLKAFSSNVILNSRESHLNK